MTINDDKTVTLSLFPKRLGEQGLTNALKNSKTSGIQIIGYTEAPNTALERFNISWLPSNESSSIILSCKASAKMTPEEALNVISTLNGTRFKGENFPDLPKVIPDAVADYFKHQLVDLARDNNFQKQVQVEGSLEHSWATTTGLANLASQVGHTDSVGETKPVSVRTR